MTAGRDTKMFVVGGLLVGLALAVFVSPWASGSPDGLEKVAEEEAFAESARHHQLADSPLADYGVEGLDHEGLATGLSGVIGVLLTFGVGFVLFAGVRMLRGGKPERPPSARGPTEPAT